MNTVPESILDLQITFITVYAVCITFILFGYWLYKKWEIKKLKNSGSAGDGEHHVVYIKDGTETVMITVGAGGGSGGCGNDGSVVHGGSTDKPLQEAIYNHIKKKTATRELQTGRKIKRKGVKRK